MFQNSKSQEFKEYSNILKELLEPYETLKLEEYEQIKETFLEVFFFYNFLSQKVFYLRFYFITWRILLIYLKQRHFLNLI